MDELQSQMKKILILTCIYAASLYAPDEQKLSVAVQYTDQRTDVHVYDNNKQELLYTSLQRYVPATIEINALTPGQQAAASHLLQQQMSKLQHKIGVIRER